MVRLLSASLAATTLAASSAVVFGAPSSLTTPECTFTDAAAAIAGKLKCSTIVLRDIHVPANMTLDMTKLNDGTRVVFDGTTTFGYAEWKGPLISVSGNRISVDATPHHLIDGGGRRWWDTLGGNGGKDKPKTFYARKLTNSRISNLHIKNSPVHVFSIGDSRDLVLDKITIDNKDGDEGMDPITHEGALSHNSDCFDVGTSDGITISNPSCTNQDDCLAVNSGSNIHFYNGICDGGHGVSIGSVGGRANNTVDSVLIENTTLRNSENGVRIKTVSNTNGTVNNVTYRNIKLENIHSYGVLVRSDYLNGGPTGIPTNGVNITNIHIENVRGTVTKEASPVFLLCGDSNCHDWTWKNVRVTGGKPAQGCVGYPAPAHC